MNRSSFIKLVTAIPLSGAMMSLRELENISETFGKTNKLPVLFTSHGNPMDMLSDTSLFRILQTQGEDIRKNYPLNAVLIISAHWNTKGTYVNISKFPETIYDFYGFPEAFYKVKYAAPGHPELGKEIASLASDIKTTDTDWGFDHGSWPILRHLFPNADVPIVQMSMDYNQPASYHFELAKKLKGLRERGVLIIGSGSMVHNIPLAMKKFQIGNFTPYGWENEFEASVMKKLEEKDFNALVDYKKIKNADLAIPTPDHYVPMLYALGVAEASENITSIHQGLVAAFSDRSFRIG
jgi:4,5-DOPA dioxygenase extradiol